jgi:hypothetical protein
MGDEATPEPAPAPAPGGLTPPSTERMPEPDKEAHQAKIAEINEKIDEKKARMVRVPACPTPHLPCSPPVLL